MKYPYLALAAIASTSALSAQTTYHEFYGLDFTDPGWKNDTTGLSSEFQTNGADKGNYAGWDSSHSISGINGSTIGASFELSHWPHATNIESRPALAPYFPSQSGNQGDIMRIWNDTSKIGTNEIPSLTMTFSEPVSLQTLSLEGYRGDDAWKIQAYDAAGNLVSPNWADPNVTVVTDPGAPLANAPINLLSKLGINGATGAEADSAGRYDATEKAFYIWNKIEVFERGAAVLNFNLDSPEVKTLVYSMIEVDENGIYAGTPSDQSMYIGSGIVAKEFQIAVPEPSSLSLLGLSALALLARRRK
ncbi:PEP-CTERM sorting domain-containing protein [Verrucomicrobiaceae bacterium 227]